jgi:8-oxo-dGTP pyrophosphatase MutT (NUDIX family)
MGLEASAEAECPSGTFIKGGGLRTEGDLMSCLGTLTEWARFLGPLGLALIVLASVLIPWTGLAFIQTLQAKRGRLRAEMAAIEKWQEQVAQTRKLQKPGQDVEVWASREINEDFQAREILREKPEVHVAGVCINANSAGIQVLLAKRSQSRDLFPLKWESCGGQLRSSELFQEGVERHFRTEMKISVDVLPGIHPELYKIERANMPKIPGLRFLCLYRDGTPASPNHQDIRWVPFSDMLNMDSDDFPPGFQDQAEQLIERYQNNEKGEKGV